MKTNLLVTMRMTAAIVAALLTAPLPHPGRIKAFHLLPAFHETDPCLDDDGFEDFAWRTESAYERQTQRMEPELTLEQFCAAYADMREACFATNARDDE